MEIAKNKKISIRIKKLLFTKREQIDFLEFMGSLLDAGIPPLSALIAIQKSHQGKRYKAIAEDLSQGMQEGKKLVDCLADWLPNDTVAVIEGYDRVGKTSEGFLDASEILSSSGHKKSEFYAILIYPFFIFILGLFLMIFLNHTLLEEVIFELVKIAHLDIPHRTIIYSNIANFIEDYWFVILIHIFIIVVAVKIFLKNFTGKIRTYLDKLPLFSFYAESQTIYFFKKLGVFLQHNINLQNSLKLMLNRNTRHLTYYIHVMLANILSGEHKIARILNVGFINKDYIYYLDVMEVAQQPGRSIDKLANLVEDHHKKTLKRIAEMIRVLLFIFGGTLLMASYLTMFDAKNVLSQYQNSERKAK